MAVEEILRVFHALEFQQLSNVFGFTTPFIYWPLCLALWILGRWLWGRRFGFPIRNAMLISVVATFFNLFGIRLLFPLIRVMLSGDFASSSDRFGLISGLTERFPHLFVSSRSFLACILILIFGAIFFKCFLEIPKCSIPRGSVVTGQHGFFITKIDNFFN